MTRTIKLSEEEYQFLLTMIGSVQRQVYVRGMATPGKVKDAPGRKDKRLPRTKLEREKYLGPCRACGLGMLELISLHHVNREKYPDMIIPLCHNCHMLYHKVYGARAVEENEAEVINKIVLKTK